MPARPRTGAAAGPEPGRRRGRRRAAGAALGAWAAALSITATAPAWAAPAACTTEPTEGCCATVALDCGAPENQLVQRNVVLVVSDDQSYCSYRFIREARDANGGSLLDDVGLAIEGAEDLTCRYRNSEEGTSEKKSFRFNRGAHEPLVSGGPDGFVGVRTPTIDRLAAQGAVFPRMHLSANVCDPSLSSLFVGKYLKDADVSYLRRGARDFRTCECKFSNTRCGRKVTAGGVTDDPLQSQCVNNGTVNNDPDCPHHDEVGACVNGTCQWTNPELAAWNGRHACTAASDCANTCGPTRTLPRLLNEASVRGLEGYVTLAGPKVYQTRGIVGDARSDFRLVKGKSVGRFPCPNAVVQGENCHEVLKDPGCTDPPCVPVKARKNLAPITTVIDALPLHGDVIPPRDGLRDGHLWRPFFFMYSPNLPHGGFVQSPYFREHFCTEPTKCRLPPKGRRTTLTALYLTNVEILDYGLDALFKHLKRSCVCENGRKKSLYDTTVIAFMTDNGWMLPKGKGARNTDDLGGENGFRTPLIVSLPEHRLPPGTPGRIEPAVFPEQLVHAIDVTRTLLAYADNGTGTVRIPWDLKGSDLRDVIAHRTTAPLRDVMIGQWSQGQKVDVFDDRWFLVTRPGLVGVCVNAAGSPGPTTTFCLESADCPTGPGGPYGCRRGDAAAPQSRVCMNRPDRVCDADDDCDEGLCQLARCLVPLKDGTSPPPARYGFRDFEARACLADADCRPAGVCQPPVLRYAVLGTPPLAINPTIRPHLERVYLLTADPDENRDLLTTPNDQLDLPLPARRKLIDCMVRWEFWQPGDAPARCAGGLNLRFGG